MSRFQGTGDAAVMENCSFSDSDSDSDSDDGGGGGTSVRSPRVRRARAELDADSLVDGGDVPPLRRPDDEDDEFTVPAAPDSPGGRWGGTGDDGGGGAEETKSGSSSDDDDGDRDRHRTGSGSGSSSRSNHKHKKKHKKKKKKRAGKSSKKKLKKQRRGGDGSDDSDDSDSSDSSSDDDDVDDDDDDDDDGDGNDGKPPKSSKKSSKKKSSKKSKKKKKKRSGGSGRSSSSRRKSSRRKKRTRRWSSGGRPHDLRLAALSWDVSRFNRAVGVSREYIAPINIIAELNECCGNDSFLAGALCRCAARLPTSTCRFADSPSALADVLNQLDSARHGQRQDAAETLLFIALGCPPLREETDPDKVLTNLNAVEPGYVPVNIDGDLALLNCTAIHSAGGLPAIVAHVINTTSAHQLASPSLRTFTSAHVSLALLHALLTTFLHTDEMTASFFVYLDSSRYGLLHHIVDLVAALSEPAVFLPVRKVMLVARRLFLLLAQAQSVGLKPSVVSDGPKEPLSWGVSRAGGCSEAGTPDHVGLPFVLMAPIMEPFLTSILQVMMASAPTVHRYSGPISLYREVAEYQRVDTDSPDQERLVSRGVMDLHAEVVSSATCHALILMLKWWKGCHPLQAEHAAQILVNRNAPVLILKYLTQDLYLYVAGSPAPPPEEELSPVASSGDEDGGGSDDGGGGGGRDGVVVDVFAGVQAEAGGAALPPLTIESDPWMGAEANVRGPIVDDGLDMVPSPTSGRDGGGAAGDTDTESSSDDPDDDSESEDVLFEGFRHPTDLRRRRLMIVFSLLRVLHRLCKGHPDRVTNHLLQFRAAPVLLRALDTPFVPIVRCSLKLLRLQVKYFSHGWRRSHMQVISAIYRFIGVVPGDDWLVMPPSPAHSEASGSRTSTTLDSPSLLMTLRVDAYLALAGRCLTRLSTNVAVALPALVEDKKVKVAAVAVEAEEGVEDGGQEEEEEEEEEEGGDEYDDAAAMVDKLATMWDEVLDIAEEGRAGVGLPPWFTSNYTAWLDVEVPLENGDSWLCGPA